ncbi:peptidase inhibitor family I36 protein [Solicola gregarius]|uniref:Peptidase inhibitor family I36 protein n=1 Tax=Solicola gregarius TaxID=2908642 RepID=A0AA46TKU9_9ACTN|nr:peptidase inhibitor family I36 protein [Solicola gregarius]UYM06278.1 peptidase inhibitor family I36 protein [Solicola gregarius]
MRKILIGSALATAATLLVVPVSPQATAAVILGPSQTDAATASGWDRCPHGSACLFEDANGQGDMYLVPPVFDGGPPRYIGDEWNDRVSSVWNRSRLEIDLYTDYPNVGMEIPLIYYGPPTNLPATSNDAISSYSVLDWGV